MAGMVADKIRSKEKQYIRLCLQGYQQKRFVISIWEMDKREYSGKNSAVLD
jgi:hypothetical protein